MRHNMTPAESRLWQRLRSGRLEGIHFRRQQVIGQFIADFYCHHARLVVEVDGGIHLEQEEYDRSRDESMRAQGLKILRFNNYQVEHEIEQVLAIILDTCRAE